MSTKKARWTIGRIAKIGKEKGYHFFDKATLDYWGDRKENWEVVERNGRVFVRLTKSHKGAKAGQVREFFQATGSISGPTELPEEK